MFANHPTRYAVLRSALAYGLGFVLGTLVMLVLLNQNVARTITALLLGPLQILLRLVIGIVLIIIIVGLSGGIAGLVGGYFSWLPRVEDAVEDKALQRKFMWHNGWSYFITHAVLILPLTIITVIVGMLNPDLDVRLLKLPSLFLTYGLLYGLVVGFFLGWFIVGFRQIIGVWIAAIAGFGLGAAILGFGAYLLANLQPTGIIVSWTVILLSVFLFGVIGGGAVEIAFLHVQKRKTIFPATRRWRVMRNVALTIILIYFLAAFVKLVDTLTIRPASLASTLVLPTKGVHWLPIDESLVESDADLTNGRKFSASCSEDGLITLLEDETTIGKIQASACLAQPIVAVDRSGDVHLVWYGNQIRQVSDIVSSGDFLFEAVFDGQSWTLPTIIARTDGVATPRFTAVSEDTLGLIWEDNSGTHQAILPDYNCDDVTLNKTGQVVYDNARQERFRPVTDPVPYCHNTYNQLLYTPNPTAPNSSADKNPNGAFDDVAEAVANAEYEVLFTTMQWDAPSDKGSPGATMAHAVADLYEKVQANPENYPRGMTVRILLGNLPDLAIFNPRSQIYHTLQDLHDAGVEEMVNEEIGWHLEVADFDGAWPHAHSKFVVIDGKTAIAAGYNYSYLHLPRDHPSGLGLDMNDKGISLTGPVAQAAMSAYDDLWSGSDLLRCSVFPPPMPLVEFLWCDTETAVATHPPEVLRFYVTEGDANAFSLHHTSAYHESDDAIISAIVNAENTIDIYEVNFSLETVCVAAMLLTGLCQDADLAPPYMDALVQAIDQNDVKVRAIFEPSAFNGMENRMGIHWIASELTQIGKTENFEAKFSNNKMHDKSILIDDEFLVIGSQNFHWSAWGPLSLTEYNLSTEAPEAIQDFKQEYEYQWQIGTPAVDLMQMK